MEAPLKMNFPNSIPNFGWKAYSSVTHEQVNVLQLNHHFS